VGLSPFEKLFLASTLFSQGPARDLKKIGDFTLRQLTQALDLTLLKINDWVRETLPVSLTNPMHPYKPEDAVWLCCCFVHPQNS
jgi:hypothetical protein